ncbi:FecR family protein [Sphingobacterium hungaricum]
MVEDRINNLFAKYYDKTISFDERNELFRWILDDKNKSQVEYLLKTFYDKEFENPNSILVEIDNHRILNSIFEQNHLQEQNNSSKKIAWIRPILAVACTILICMFFLFKFSDRDKQIIDPNASAVNDIPAGGNRAILTLGNGEEVLLDSLNSGESLTESNILITKSADGLLTYTMPNGIDNINSYNTLSTPIGGFFQIVLSDGTKVWLNALSSLKFTPSFPKNERRVELTGEAYFEVAKDATKPFIVDVNGTSVKVLGTHFNINSYETNSNTSTTVLEGAVLVSKNDFNKKIIPGQQALTSENGEMLLNKAVDLSEVVAWKDGYFSKGSIQFKILMDEVSRWYGVKLDYKDNIDTEFVGRFPKNLSLQELISVLELTKVVKFELNNKTLKIMKM